MKILELSTKHLSEAAEIQNTARRQGGPRSKGLHISELIRSLQNTVTHKGKRKPFDQLTSEEKRRMGGYTSMGWAFERVIEEALKEVWSGYFRVHDRYEKPGELHLDGLTGTPDWMDMEDWSVIEFKATWRSSRRKIEEDFVSWLWQIGAYCKMLSTRTAQLYVFFVNGDYRESGPQLKAFAIHFEKHEIEAYWKMLLQEGRRPGR